ncbi:hypothetical protein AO715_11815 [Xanthomonas sp. Mitacek01]|nr:hypothetical protein AO715_11815 [Xanthomonas sp. Mitacek01]
MSQLPPRIHRDRHEIVAIEDRIRHLHDEARVRLTLRDGSVVAGTVSVRPTIETFRDAEGEEGHNALLRLDDLDDPAVPHYVWVGEIVEMERLGTS